MLQNMHTDQEAPNAKEFMSPQTNKILSTDNDDPKALKLAKLKSEILSDQH